jgi:hypothetical protein
VGAFVREWFGVSVRLAAARRRNAMATLPFTAATTDDNVVSKEQHPAVTP